MLTVHAAAETSATPEAVIAAAFDFSERRAEIWPNVKAGHFEVHVCCEEYTEATEYLWPLGFYERCRYERLRPGHVCATVLDSNVLVAGSTWDLAAAAVDGTTHVEVALKREFTPCSRGRVAKALNHALAPRLLVVDLRHTLARIEKQERAAPA